MAMNRIMISTPDKLINVNGNKWVVDDGYLTVYLDGKVTFSSAPGAWNHVASGVLGDIFIKPGGFLVKGPEEETASNSAEPKQPSRVLVTLQSEYERGVRDGQRLARAKMIGAIDMAFPTSSEQNEPGIDFPIIGRIS